jgi:hypothetical protein
LLIDTLIYEKSLCGNTPPVEKWLGGNSPQFQKKSSGQEKEEKLFVFFIFISLLKPGLPDGIFSKQKIFGRFWRVL